jgi:hypothetical protein
MMRMFSTSDIKGKGKAVEDEMDMDNNDHVSPMVIDHDPPQTKSERITALIYAGRLSEASDEVHGEYALKVLENGESTSFFYTSFFLFSFILMQAGTTG